MVRDVVRIAAMADLHYGKGQQGALAPVAAQVGDRADVLVLAGDLTDHGLPDEARALVKELGTPVRVPTVAVFGNHDVEAGKQDEIGQILTDAGITILDGETCEIHGIAFAGVKGFGGGFGPRALGPWGEDIIKAFVHAAVAEALKLESALARLRTPHRFAVMHYSPIQATCEGEPREIFPFLGSSRLEEPLNRYAVTAVFHGHAHHGRLEGRTIGDVPVYNVAWPLLREAFPDAPPFRILEVRLPPTSDEPPPAPGSTPVTSVAVAREG